MENTQIIKVNRKGIDCIKGISIIMIVLYHVFPSTFSGGFLGVPMFFVLSGYLMYISGINRVEKDRFNPINYYIGRIRRIYPPLYVMVITVCCYLTLTKSRLLTGMWKELTCIFSGCYNWWQISENSSYFSSMSEASPFMHLWFIAVEIQLCIIWPVLFFLYRRICITLNNRTAILVFLIPALLSAVRMSILYVPGSDPSRVYYGTDTMAFPLLIGLTLGAIRKQYGKPDIRISGTGRITIVSASIIMAVCALCLTVNGSQDFLYRGGIFIFSILCAAIIITVECFEFKTTRHNILSFLGKNSYSIYLWHYPLIILF